MKDGSCLEFFVALATQRLDEIVKFYEGLLQEKPHTYQVGKYAEFGLHGTKLSIFTPNQAGVAEFSNIGRGAMSLCFEVASLEGAIALLTELGYPPTGEIMTVSHGREIYARDPDGNRLILHES